MSKYWLPAAATSLFVLFVAFSLFAQIQNGQFTGTVMDPSGAAIPNAKVTVKNNGTDLAVDVNATQSGLFVARELPPGIYTITAQAPGFKSLSHTNVTLNAGTIARVDMKLEVGQVSQTVEVSAEAAQVNTEDSRLSTTVGATQIANLPLNGRNVYDLIQMPPGAVNVRNVVSENGANTVVNGVREDFNGFLVNGVSNKDLSGGNVNQPIVDTVQEFQMLTLNMSAQYGNSAGSVTNLVTKGGSNALHGSAFEFLRNDALDANFFFLNHTNPVTKKPPLRFNQFGGTIGGPIVKDKLFFFGAYQGDRFTTTAPPAPITVESPEWRAAVLAADSGQQTVAGLLYSQFPPTVTGTPHLLISDYVATNPTTGISISPSGFGGTAFTDYLCDAFINPSPTDPSAGLKYAQRLARIIGVTASEAAFLADPANGCTPLPMQAGTFNRSLPFINQATTLAPSKAVGNLFQGNEASLRIDWNAGSKDRLFTQFNFQRTSDPFSGSTLNGARGFFGPFKGDFPNFQFSEIHTFSPSILNEFRAGYTLSKTLFNAGLPGVPQIGFSDLTLGIGSYSGYPQFFKDNIYSYSDMVSLNHGSHSIKAGVDVRRNLENSQFSVGRPYYYFFDPLFFAMDLPAIEDVGVDPGLKQNPSNPTAQLSQNVRHWRNWEYGAYLQDDWKATRRLTLNLGLRYDLYTRHNEENDLATTFIHGPGNGLGTIQNANIPFGEPGCDSSITLLHTAPLAGVCGPGGFAPTKHLGKGDHNNFGPRFGFAWDVFGNGKTALRGGAGVSYEGTLYNPLSNSRWNLPYYSFNDANNALEGGVENLVYGPQTPGQPPRFTGAPDPLNFEGVGAQAVGNINGWDPTNANVAIRTGLVFPEGIRDPYVYNYFYGIQEELAPTLVLELNYVGTTGHKLFKAENVNRVPGGRLPLGLCLQDNLGRTDCGLADRTINPVDPLSRLNPRGRLNPNYGNLRSWLNVSNSNYNSLQAALKKRVSHGIQFNVNYTWSHSLDDSSTWHSGATTANGPAGGDGYYTDSLLHSLDRGNSIYDVRHRIVANYVWDIPIFRGQTGFLGKVLGGWTYNGIFSYQSGAHWMPYNSHSRSFVDTNPAFIATDPLSHACRSAATFVAAGCTNVGGDYNLDGQGNDRPNALASNFDPSHNQWADGWGSQFTSGGTFFSTPCGGTTPCIGNLGRNSFVGPKFWDVDMSLFKNIKITERVNAQFRAESFNIFNHTNFTLPGNQGHNEINDPSFGQAGGTFDPRELQFGLKITF